MRGRPVGTGWKGDEPVPAHKLDLVYSNNELVARCVTPKGAPPCSWAHRTMIEVWYPENGGARVSRQEPPELTSYHHWMHQLDELRKAGL